MVLREFLDFSTRLRTKRRGFLPYIPWPTLNTRPSLIIFGKNYKGGRFFFHCIPNPAEFFYPFLIPTQPKLSILKKK